MEILQFGTPSNLSTNNITDLNADNPTGFYASNSAANSPIAGAHFLYVINRLNQAANYQQQFASRISDNTQLWYRMLSVDGVLEEWRTLAVESSGNWTPTIGGTLTNGTSHNYTIQIGRWFRQGSIVRLNFRVKGTFSSAPNRPTGSPTIRSLPFTAKNESGFYWSNVALQSNIGGEGISGNAIFAIKHNENFIRFQLNSTGVNGNMEYEGVNNNIWNYGSNFDFAGDLVYEIA